MAGIWPPARKSVLESEAFLSSNPAITPEQMKDAVAASIETGQVLPSHEMYPQIEVESRILYDKLWNAGADVAAVMQEVAALYRNYIK
jgi:multiple sugar transport system substrate-binding protein